MVGTVILSCDVSASDGLVGPEMSGAAVSNIAFACVLYNMCAAPKSVSSYSKTMAAQRSSLRANR